MAIFRDLLLVCDTAAIDGASLADIAAAVERAEAFLWRTPHQARPKDAGARAVAPLPRGLEPDFPYADFNGE